MTCFQKGRIAYIALIFGAFILLFLVGCSLQPLRQNESRKIVAWGFWMVPFGTPIGIGYFHSERGPDIESEQSPKPPAPTIPWTLKP